MIDVNEIMDMLDWNNPPEIQKEGRKLGAYIKCLKIFMQPGDRQYNKNVWDNCALILKEKSDELLRPYMIELFDWIRDLNWPGAMIILERLKKFRDLEWLAFSIKEETLQAKALNEEVWLMNIAELLDREEVVSYLSDEIVEILRNSREE